MLNSGITQFDKLDCGAPATFSNAWHWPPPTALMRVGRVHVASKRSLVGLRGLTGALAAVQKPENVIRVSKIEPRPARQGCKVHRRPLTEFTALSISTNTRTCPHCAEPMFLVNLEREGHDHLHAYKCSNCKRTSQFVPLSDAPTLWLTPETRSLKIGSNN